MPATITIQLKAWDGSPAGRTLIQGCQWDPVNKCYFVHQADDVAGRREQSIVIRRHDADGTYRGYVTLADAGHGSSMGVEPVGLGHTRLWLGHATKGVGYVDYVQGQAAAPFVPVGALPAGDVSVDAVRDQLCIRNGGRYRVYVLSAARAGKAKKVAEFTISDWYSRFQGHLIAGGKVYVHRDVATGGKSTLRAFNLKGKKVGEWDTTDWGDEAEGAMVKDGWVYSVSRVGGSGPGRTVVCTPVELAEPPPTPEYIGTWVVDPGKVSTVLLGRDRAGKTGWELSPGTTIADGVEWVVNAVGRYALLRANGISYDREFLVQVGPALVGRRQFPVIPDYDQTERIKFRGGLTCRCVAIALPWLEYALLEAGVIKFNIDVYQLGYRTDVAASAGTHARGGAVDLGQYADAALKVARSLGWTLQHRTPPDFDHHAHGWPKGCPHLSSGAVTQARAWERGRDGLLRNGPIGGSGPTGEATPRWDTALSAFLKKIGAPPVAIEGE